MLVNTLKFDNILFVFCMTNSFSRSSIAIIQKKHAASDMRKQSCGENSMETEREFGLIVLFCLIFQLVLACHRLLFHFQDISSLKPMHSIGKVSVNASILYNNQETCNKTNL